MHTTSEIDTRLTPPQAEVAQQLYDAGKHTVQQNADMFSVPRSTVYGHLGKASIGERPATSIRSQGRAATLGAPQA